MRKKTNNLFEVELVMEWLKSKHTTMWGGSGWTVTKDDTCKAAAEWFTEQITEYLSWRENAK